MLFLFDQSVEPSSSLVESLRDEVSWESPLENLQNVNYGVTPSQPIEFGGLGKDLKTTPGSDLHFCAHNRPISQVSPLSGPGSGFFGKELNFSPHVPAQPIKSGGIGKDRTI